MAPGARGSAPAGAPGPEAAFLLWGSRRPTCRPSRPVSGSCNLGTGFLAPGRRSVPVASWASAAGRCCTCRRSPLHFSSSKLTVAVGAPVFLISAVVVTLSGEEVAGVMSRESSVRSLPPPPFSVFVVVVRTAGVSDTGPVMRRGIHSALLLRHTRACPRRRGRSVDRCKVRPRGHQLVNCQQLFTDSICADEAMLGAEAQDPVRYHKPWSDPFPIRENHTRELGHCILYVTYSRFAGAE